MTVNIEAERKSLRLRVALLNKQSATEPNGQLVVLAAGFIRLLEHQLLLLDEIERLRKEVEQLKTNDNTT